MKVNLINNYPQIPYRGKYGNNFVNTFFGTVDKPKNMEQSEIILKNFIRDRFNITTDSADDIIEALILRIKELNAKNFEKAEQIKKIEEENQGYKSLLEKL